MPFGSGDDLPAILALEDFGFVVRSKPWDDPNTKWREFDCVIIRSTWDYHLRQREFEDWLLTLKDDGIPVLNPVETIFWNRRKTYLAGLEELGVSIVPTVWVRQGEKFDFQQILADAGWDKAVVKPVSSLNAHNTRLLPGSDSAEDAEFLAEVHREGDLMIQQYIESVSTVGEWSLIYFNGRFSHAVLKKTVGEEFRVQERFGGYSKAAVPSADLVKQCDEIAATIPYPWIYARIDGLIEGGTFLLMELELIEPMLFFSFDSRAAGRFALAVKATLD